VFSLAASPLAVAAESVLQALLCATLRLNWLGAAAASLLASVCSYDWIEAMDANSDSTWQTKEKQALKQIIWKNGLH
jgi:hypothetical protein